MERLYVFMTVVIYSQVGSSDAFNDTTYNMTCSLEPCENGGTCVGEEDGGFSCLCSVDYSGTVCETDIAIDETACDDVQCLNDGTCVPQPGGGAACVCYRGYEGEDCSINIDECASSPCQHGGVCMDEISVYWCACDFSRYGGRDCEVVLPNVTCFECAHYPLIHGSSEVSEDSYNSAMEQFNTPSGITCYYGGTTHDMPSAVCYGYEPVCLIQQEIYTAHSAQGDSAAFAIQSYECLRDRYETAEWLDGDVLESGQCAHGVLYAADEESYEDVGDVFMEAGMNEITDITTTVGSCVCDSENCNDVEFATGLPPFSISSDDVTPNRNVSCYVCEYLPLIHGSSEVSEESFQASLEAFGGPSGINCFDGGTTHDMPSAVCDGYEPMCMIHQVIYTAHSATGDSAALAIQNYGCLPYHSLMTEWLDGYVLEAGQCAHGISYAVDEDLDEGVREQFTEAGMAEIRDVTATIGGCVCDGDNCNVVTFASGLPPLSGSSSSERATLGLSTVLIYLIMGLISGVYSYV